MKVLVCGAARSGNSLIAQIVSHAAGDLSILDDPLWAVADASGMLAYRANPNAKAELNLYDIVKCPRALRDLLQVYSDYSTISTWVVFRDPRDVYCSIVEAVATGNKQPRTMIEYYSNDLGFLQGFIEAYNFQYRTALNFAQENPKIKFLCYESTFAELRNNTLGAQQCSRFEYPSLTINYSPIENNLESMIWGPNRHENHMPKLISELIWKNCSQTYLRLFDEKLSPFALLRSTGLCEICTTMPLLTEISLIVSINVDNG